MLGCMTQAMCLRTQPSPFASSAQSAVNSSLQALHRCTVWQRLAPNGTCSCRDTTLKFNRKVEDLEDVRYLVNVLNEASAIPVLARRPARSTDHAVAGSVILCCCQNLMIEMNSR